MKTVGKIISSWFRSRSPTLNGPVDLALHLKKGTFSNVLVILGPMASEGSFSPELVHIERLVAGHKTKFESKELDFDSRYFKLDPNLFFEGIGKLLDILSDCKPSFTHFFLTHLQSLGNLLRVYSLNIDGMEKTAGIHEEKLVCLNGNLDSCHCSNSQCKRKYDIQFVKSYTERNELPLCSECKSPVKPDIRLSEDAIVYDELKRLCRDANSCDLLLIIGTDLTSSLTGDMIRMIVDNMNSPKPAVYINRVPPFLKAHWTLEELEACDPFFQTLSKYAEWDDEIYTLERNFYNKSLQS